MQKDEERQRPGWKTRLFTLEKPKGSLTLGQIVGILVIVIGLYVANHGWPG